MNRWEREWAAKLEAERLTGNILWWGWEAVKLRLADRTWYTPDFAVLNKDLSLDFHEVKGFMRDDAAVKIKVAAETYPFAFFLLQKRRGEWVHKRMPGKRVGS